MGGCVESTALLGPGITVGATGNVYQAGLSYGTNQLVKEVTGKDTTSHIKNFFENSKCKNEFSCSVTDHVKKTHELLKKHKGSFN